jgi:hypothetical protein
MKNRRICTMSDQGKVSEERLKEIAESTVVFDDDIPEFSEEQLSFFRPANPQFFNSSSEKKPE